MISTNVSSIQAHQTWLNNSANNVANVNTNGFVPSDTTLTDGQNRNVKASTAQAKNDGSTQSQTDLSKEIPDQITITNSVAANVSGINTQNEMYGSLLDIKA
jgi:flagellar hook protein FlgE